MRLRLLGRELAALHQLVDERVVLGELLHDAVAQQIRARVADVAERDACALDERGGDRRPHPGGGRIGVGALVDAAVRLLDQRDDALLAADRAGVGVLERRRSEPRRDLARLGAAHAVGDREERRGDDERVLVAPPLVAGVRLAADGADAHSSNLSSVSPTRTTSPRSSLRGRSIRAPFTYVPFVEPTSLDPDAVAARLDPHVLRGRELVAVDRDVVLRATADGELPRRRARTHRRP